MPPRLTLPSILGSSPLCLRPAKSTPGTLISVAHASGKSKTDRRKPHKDAYAIAQSEARKQANLRRRKELQEQRAKLPGDPIRGNRTPFIESFFKTDNPIARPPKASSTALVLHDSEQPELAPETYLNHFLTHSEVKQSLEQSYILTQPIPSKDLQDPVEYDEQVKRHREGHRNAVAAIQRILKLENGSGQDRLLVNKQRCIATFGRHNTDLVLPKVVAPEQPRRPDASPPPEPTPRAGPDTGSSEVQIAILTAKINNLVEALDKKGANKDKMNRRNLRLMVHKRQKLMKYLRRKDHGGPRWQNLVNTLGLTDGMWEGEITLKY